MSAILLAIDPGSVSGAYAVFFDDREPYVADLPVVDGQINPYGLSNIVSVLGVKNAVVERVASMPKQGVASTFKFGVSVGIIHGVLASHGVAMRLVTPSEWKRGMKIGADKEVARALAIRTYPKVEGLYLKKHQGRAEALLLGHYVLKGGL